MILLLASIFVVIYVGLFVVLNILKLKNKSNTLKIAFFHPFWYILQVYKVTTVEVDRKFSGAFSMPYWITRTRIAFQK